MDLLQDSLEVYSDYKMDEKRIVPKESKEKIMVVSQLPTQEVREFVDEKGNKTKIMTIEEYLTELANS